jgi:tetratricopeptide (TPR) repeat protein
VRAGLLTVVVACSVVVAPAWAQTPTAPAPAKAAPAAAPAAAAPPTEQQRAAAREAYARGQKAFADGRYEEARSAFAEAYAAVPNPIVLVTLAECDLRLGRFEEAHGSFERYLRDKPDAPDRAQVEQKIADLLATPSILVLTSSPSGAQVKLDGADTGKVTPIELTVPRGEHRIELTLAGHLPIAETLDVRIGARQELHVGLQPVPPPQARAPVAPKPAAPPKPPPSDPTTALWITSIVGATGIVAGSVLGFLVLSERSDFDENPTAASADRGERLALFADVAFGLGAMALVTGAVLYLTKEPAQEPAAAKAQAWTFTPIASTQGGGVTAQVRY